MNIEKRLKQIKNENIIWILYIGIILLCFYANNKEKDYFLTNNQNSKETYRRINIIVFIILIGVYSYFEKDAISSFQDKNKSKKEQEYDTLILLASTLVLISGLIYLYIIIQDNDINEEIAFS